MVIVIEDNVFNTTQTKLLKEMVEDFVVYESNGQINDEYFSYYNKKPVELPETIANKIIKVVSEATGHNYKIHNALINWVGVGTNEDDDFHKDVFSDLTFLYYPSKNYDGGELEWIEELKVKGIKPRKGVSVLINDHTPHRVKKVTKGDRYSLVVFLNVIKSAI
jgi:predicted 2-oxoglutarate/Fe(II)-dependent dioxygenase YbiX